MAKIGDIVIYKEPNGVPSRSGVQVHPAIVTYQYPNESLDLTVFFHDYEPEAVSHVPFGTSDIDGACWWERP